MTRRASHLCPLALLCSLVLGLAVHATGCLYSNDLSDCSQYPTPTCFDGGTGGQEGGTGGGETGTGGHDSGPPPSCIPSEDTATVADTCGVFVSSSMGSDAPGKGSKEAPYKTLTKALAERRGGPCTRAARRSPRP